MVIVQAGYIQGSAWEYVRAECERESVYQFFGAVERALEIVQPDGHALEIVQAVERALEIGQAVERALGTCQVVERALEIVRA